MRIKDGCLTRSLSLKIFLLLFILLLPFALSGLTVSQSAYMNDVGFKEETSSYTNSLLVAGGFKHFNVALNVEAERICIIAYYGDSIPEIEDRSVGNYYRWEYDNGVWKDISGHDSEYIQPSLCIKNDEIYSFYIGIANDAKQGQWTIKIFIDNEETEATTSSVVVVSHFNFFLLSLVGVYEPYFREKKSIVDTDFICTDRKKIMVEPKDDVDDIVDKVLRRHATSNKEDSTEEINDLCFFGNTNSPEDESAKSTISTYPRSKLKTKNTNAVSSMVFNKKEGGGNVFCSAKSGSHRRFFSIILAFFLLSVAFIPVIAPQDPESSEKPMISSFNVFPEEVNPGDSLLLNVSINDRVGITSVIADIAGLETINLSFVEGEIVNSTIYSGLWQRNWLVYDVDPGNYTIMVTVQNKDNMSISQYCTFTVLSTYNQNMAQIGKQTGDITNSSNNTVQNEIQNNTIPLNNNSFYENSTSSSDPTATTDFEDDINKVTPGFTDDAPYINHYAPDDSFGISTVKVVNWNKFWQLFEEQSAWSLEAFDSENNKWINTDEYLTVEKNKSADKSNEKISLNFIAPYTTDYRLTYDINLPVKSYVNHSEQYEYILTYYVNKEEDYTVFYNWSDMVGLPEPLIFEHGMKTVDGNEYFYFRVMTGDKNNLMDDIIAGSDVLLDPIFGNTGTSTNGQDGDDMPGGYFQMGGTGGTADSITAYFSTAGGGNSGKAAIYDTNGDLLTNGVTNENISVGDGWVEFDYSTGPTLTADAWYYLVVFTDSQKSELMYAASGGNGLYTDIGETYPNFPDPYAATQVDSGYYVSIYCTYTTPPDVDPPSPDPLTWSTPPYNASSSSITMIATTASDDTPPITYYFNETTGNSGGSDGTWQASTTYTDEGLSENTQYGYEVKARDSNSTPNEGNYSTPISYEYTSVDSPTDGELTNSIGITWMNASVAQPPNPTTGSTGSYFNWITGGAANSGWQNGIYYHNRTSLSENTNYGSQVQYRNADAEATSYNPTEKTNYTLCGLPTDEELTLTSGVTWVNATVVAPTNPTTGSTGSYFNWITGGAANSGWQNGIYYHNRTSLSENTNYGSQVQYRNADAEATSYNPTEKTNYTLCGLPTDEELTLTSGVTWVNATVVAPTNPTTGSTGSYFNWITGGAANSGWQNGIYYHNRTSLSENTEYGSQVRYRNAESEITIYNPAEKTKYTLCNPPTDGEFTIDGHGINWMNMSVAHPPNPSSGLTAAYFECVTGGAPDSGWVTDSESGRYYYNATGLSGGTTYGYRVRYRSGDSEETTYTSEKQDTTDVGVALPTVITYSSIGVEETNATLRGWLQNNGTADTTCYFLWDTVNPPTTNNESQGIIANGAEFEYDTSGIGSLNKGTLYYFDTKAVNSEGWDETGGVEAFLTKPDPLTSFSAIVVSTTRIDLTWTDGTGGDGAYIEYSIDTPPSPWNEGDGTTVDADGNVTTPFSHTSLTSGSHYYYKAWAYATDGSWTSSGNESAPRGDGPQTADGIVPAVPIVVTNESTGVEETNATLNGYLQYNGSVDTTCYFLWDTVNPPTTNNESQGIIGNNTEFSYDTSIIGLLTKGTLYYFDTKASNSGGWDETGGVKTFLTKPDPPSDLFAQANSSSTIIYLTWDIGTAANTTHVERNSAPNWALGEGAEIYNGSGSNYEDTGLEEGITFYYQAWSFANWTYDSTTLHQFSDDNSSDYNRTNVIPTIADEVPANESTSISVIPQMIITVNHADGDSMSITWYSNSSGLWKVFGTNVTGVDGNGTYYQINSNFSNYSKTYYWNVSVSDGFDNNDSDTFYFTTEVIATSVDPISPYIITDNPNTITATGDSVLENVSLYYRWSEDNSSWDSWNELSYDDFENGFGNYTDGGVDCEIYTGLTYPHEGSSAAQIQDDTGVDASFYTTTGIDVDTPGYKCIRVDFWFIANGMGTGHQFYLEYWDGTEWLTPATYTAVTDFVNDVFYHEIVWINESSYTFPTDMQIRFRCDALNNNQQVYIDEIYVNTTTQSAGGNGINWTLWNNANNPDNTYSWSWDFNFLNETGYYEFYSIGNKSGSPDEIAPASADAICYYKIPTLIINSYDLRNVSGSKINNVTGSLDVNSEYYFLINVTDESGWNVVDYINITAWYDNGSDITIYNQSNNLGGNLNMYLQYENTTGTANYRMLWPDDEVQIIQGKCSETIINATTRIINITFKPLSQVRWGGGDGVWDTTQNTFNDIYSWNFNITVNDSFEKNDSKIDEFGVYKYTFISPEEDWVDVIASPGFSDSSSIVTITYSSNYDFNITIYFEENLTNVTWGKSIAIADNVTILADADLTDDITSDITFLGIEEVYAVDIFNDSGIFNNNSVSQTVNVQFDIYIPLGTIGGIYTARVAIKIIQD